MGARGGSLTFTRLFTQGALPKDLRRKFLEAAKLRVFEPLKPEDEFEIDGVQTPRIFVSARDATGLPALRSRLANIARQTPAEENSVELSPVNLGDDL